MSESPTGIPETAPVATDRNLIVEPSYTARTLWLMRCALIAAFEDNCFSIAKGVAYSLMLSLFPILTTLTILLFQINLQSIVHVIAKFAQEILPPGTEDLVLSRLRGRVGRPITFPLLAAAVSLWAGSGAIASLLEGFQAAYRIPSGRSMLRQRAMAIFLVLISAVPLFAASVLVIFGSRLETAWVHWVGIDEITGPVHAFWKIAQFGVAFGAVTLVTGLLYYFGPNHRAEPERVSEKIGSRFARVWPGAVLATILWLIATAGFTWYVTHLAHYNIFYGSIYTVVILLIWLYLLACITFFGCEFNAERERIASLSDF